MDICLNTEYHIKNGMFKGQTILIENTVESIFGTAWFLKLNNSYVVDFIRRCTSSKINFMDCGQCYYGHMHGFGVIVSEEQLEPIS